MKRLFILLAAMKRIITTSIVIVLCFLCVGCKKDSCENCPQLLPTEYNTMTQFFQYFKCHPEDWNDRTWDSLLVTGYIDETFAYLSESYSRIYLSDAYWEPLTNWDHSWFGFCIIDKSKFSLSMLEGFRGKRVYAKIGTKSNGANWSNDSEPPEGSIIDIDTIPHGMI